VFQFSAKTGCFLKKVIAVNIAVRAPGAPGAGGAISYWIFDMLLDYRYPTHFSFQIYENICIYCI